MNNVLISIFAAINLLILPATPSASIAKEDASRVPVKNDMIHTVKTGESLSGIAGDYYGSSGHWTTIWNDNANVENPSIINEGEVIKLRVQKPKEPEKLKPELENRIIAFSAVTVSQISVPASSINSIPQSGPLTETQMEFLGNCESGMTANRNSGNGYYGAFQFSQGTWSRMNTRYARADMAPLEEQKNAVQKLVSQSSIFGQFPECSRRMRAQGLI